MKRCLFLAKTLLKQLEFLSAPHISLKHFSKGKKKKNLPRKTVVIKTPFEILSFVVPNPFVLIHHPHLCVSGDSG